MIPQETHDEIDALIEKLGLLIDNHSPVVVVGALAPILAFSYKLMCNDDEKLEGYIEQLAVYIRAQYKTLKRIERESAEEES